MWHYRTEQIQINPHSPPKHVHQKNSDGIDRGLRGGSTVHRTEIEDPIGNSRKLVKNEFVKKYFFVSEEEDKSI